MEEAAERASPRQRQCPRPGAERAADHEQWRGDDHECLVLHHVRREQARGERVEGADERRRGDEPRGREGERAPRVDAAAGARVPPQTRDAEHVERAAEHEACDCPRLEWPPIDRQGLGRRVERVREDGPARAGDCREQRGAHDAAHRPRARPQ